jgi:large conductance mechanosensitive channel
MKKIWEEFKDFLNRGDFVTIAIGLVMALYFQKIVDSILNGVINPSSPPSSASRTSMTSASTWASPASASG